MRKLISIGATMLLASWMGNGRAAAETPNEDEIGVTAATLQSANEYPALTRGQVVIVNAQRLVVTQEPLPVATIEQAPPAPPATTVDRPALPYAGAIWVEGHWAFGASGFTWVTGRYIPPRRGHVFVPPRWAFLEDQYFYFNGFYVPYGVYVRSHFNRYYYSGRPPAAVGTAHGPYWPIGAPSVTAASSTSARVRDPYWPIGAPR